MNLLKSNSLVNLALFPAPRSSYKNDSFPNELIFLEGPNGKFPCLFIKAQNSKGLILYFHGNGEDLGYAYDTMFSYSKRLHFDILAVEYPGYGTAMGSPSEASLLQNAEVAIQFVLQYFKPNNNSNNDNIDENDANVRDEIIEQRPKIGVFGRSIGTGLACQIASKYDVDFLLLHSAYLSVKSIVKSLVGYFPSWFVMDRFDNHNAINNIRCPTMLIHGENDTLIPCEHSKVLYNKSPASVKDILIAPGADHNYFHEERHLFTPISQFLGSLYPNQEVDSTKALVDAIPKEFYDAPAFSGNTPPGMFSKLLGGVGSVSSSLFEVSCAMVTPDKSVQADSKKNIEK